METITKDDIRQAFSKRRRGKFNLLYLYYKDQYFHKGLPAQVIAQKISTDLSLTITAQNIYEIHRRYSQNVSILSQLKDELKQEILNSLKQGSPGILQENSASKQHTNTDHNINTDHSQATAINQEPGSKSFLIDPALSIDAFEIFLRDNHLSVDQLEKALEQQADIAKKIILSEKIKQVRFLENYNNNSPKKSIFD
ncbi:hypothetical protein QNI16_35830 [Cytophagaceae bacterium YF14B1]|uniref:Uncharacterized protein n=1 Tax=Xanthocytophaga flava TaxID=3048013 RepID=A0AAE3QUV6_9BACT|nr:hypothetical protein [Xanthocytophaga flavus]MDJ1485907.1 hypothetical protein [Xanthocytophaga flavus]